MGAKVIFFVSKFQQGLTYSTMYYRLIYSIECYMYGCSFHQCALQTEVVKIPTLLLLMVPCCVAEPD